MAYKQLCGLFDYHMCFVSQQIFNEHEKNGLEGRAIELHGISIVYTLVFLATLQSTVQSVHLRL